MSSERDLPGPEHPSGGRGEDEPLVAPVERGGGGDPGQGAENSLVEPAGGQPPEHRDSHNMLPPRERRRTLVERLLVRAIATGGIIGIGVAIAAIMVSNHSQGWIVGLVVSIVSVVLAAILWSSRQL
jgi:hypothetical protein